jgi:hypothetical protein
MYYHRLRERALDELLVIAKQLGGRNEGEGRELPQKALDFRFLFAYSSSHFDIAFR